MYCEKDIKKVLISKEQIGKRVKELGKEISRDFQGKRLLVICVLKGAWVFSADLLRSVDLDVDLDFICLSSYGSGTVSSGNVKVKKDLTYDCSGRDVLIIEDIIDSGVTLCNLQKLLLSRNAASVEITTLLSKPARREVDVKVKYVGFEIPDEFVVGYGMDYAEKYRNLDEICVLNPSVYAQK